MPLAAKERSPEPDQESREIFPGDELLSHDLIPDTLCWRASSGKIEREQRTKGKERSVTVHTSFITTPKIVARTMDSSFAATECCTSNLLSTTSPTIDNQIGHSRHLSEILGTTTVIVGGAERIQRFEDLTRLIAAERAQKRLISKSSLAQLVSSFHWASKSRPIFTECWGLFLTIYVCSMYSIVNKIIRSKNSPIRLIMSCQFITQTKMTPT